MKNFIYLCLILVIEMWMPDLGLSARTVFVIAMLHLQMFVGLLFWLTLGNAKEKVSMWIFMIFWLPMIFMTESERESLLGED